MSDKSPSANPEPLRLVSLPELARHTNNAPSTVARRLAAAGLTPDAILTMGSGRPASACFLTDRVPELCRVIRADPLPLIV